MRKVRKGETMNCRECGEPLQLTERWVRSELVRYVHCKTCRYIKPWDIYQRDIMEKVML